MSAREFLQLSQNTVLSVTAAMHVSQKDRSVFSNFSYNVHNSLHYISFPRTFVHHCIVVI